MGTMMKRFQEVMGWTDEEMNAFAQEIVQSVASEETMKSILAHSNDGKIEDMVTKFVRDIGCPTQINGYNYIKMALILMVKDKKHYRGKIVNNLYPKIAAEYDVTRWCIEDSIRHAIQVMYNQASNELLNEIIGASLPYKSGLPCNSQFLHSCTDYLEQQLKKAPKE